MPHMLTLLHELPFAIMGDKENATMNQHIEAGTDFVIKMYKPTAEFAKQLPHGVYIAYVEPKETDDAPDNQTVA